MRISKSTRDRFMSYVDKTRNCWLWKRSTDTNGYGQFYIVKKKHVAHRFAWKMIRGSIPRGLFVLHRCDNPPCVNPKHLFLGTQADNIHDMMAKGRMRSYFGGGEQNFQAKLTFKQVAEIRRLRGVRLQRDIAANFGVSRKTVGAIQRMETWK